VREPSEVEFDRPVLTWRGDQDPPLPISWRYLLGR
jgi:hypothetical protein